MDKKGVLPLNSTALVSPLFVLPYKQDTIGVRRIVLGS